MKDSELLKKIDLQQRKDHARFWKIIVVLFTIFLLYSTYFVTDIVNKDLDRADTTRIKTINYEWANGWCYRVRSIPNEPLGEPYPCKFKANYSEHISYVHENRDLLGRKILGGFFTIFFILIGCLAVFFWIEIDKRYNLKKRR